MNKVKIKPLSVNIAWQGKRYKTKDYFLFAKKLHVLLPHNFSIPDGKLEIIIHFGVSNSLSDWDNPIKPFQDVLCTRYGINDNRIYKGTVYKKIVKKGEEYIKFEICKYEEEEGERVGEK